MAARVFLLLTTISCIFFANPPVLQAQTFEFSLESLSERYGRAEWDTLGPGDIRFLIIGEYYQFPNFLPHDFRRVRVVEEYDAGGEYKFTFTVPKIYSFRQEEEKQGSFLTLKPRDVDIPGLEIEIESIDDIAEKIRQGSFSKVWKQSISNRFAGQQVQLRGRKGLIHVDIPLPLGPLEKLVGEGEKTNIDISGRESITFAGESRRVDPFIGMEGQTKQPLFPSLEMKQELDIRLNGQIGEKVNVQVDHTSSQFGDKQNKIRLNYVGFEDDIIQRIEFGNTSLTLPGGQSGGFSAASQGLFGIKMLAQMGSVDLTMIASKQEGEASTASFTPTGGAIGQVESRRIMDINYVSNTYFYLGHPEYEPDSLLKLSGGEIEVFISVTTAELANDPELQALTHPGRAFIDFSGQGSDIEAARIALEAGQVPDAPYEKGRFKLLNFGTDYRFVIDADDVEGSVIGIELTRRVEDTQVLGVRYVNQAGHIIGDYEVFPKPDSLYLELIKPRSPRPTDQFGYTWHYMMRNIYNLGLAEIDAATLEIEIEDRSSRPDRTIPEGEDVPYLRIFGLDRVDDKGDLIPDSRIDLTAGLINLDQGILIFPTLRPFDPPIERVKAWTKGDTSFKVPDDFEGMANPDLYDKYLSGSDLNDAYRFDIVVRAASTTRSFKINAFNIIEGSEVVSLDGRRLTRDVDYSIDYLTGDVELRGDVANELTPSSQIKIDYEFKPFAGAASSSLIGFNALWNISKTSRLGTTWLYESKSAGTLKPRIGEEPTRAVVGDLYGNLQFELGLLTDMVNLLPLVDTETQSTVTVGGGIAASFPDPNTKGEAYIDDMEGVEDSDVISLNRRNWYWASLPVDPEGDGFTALSDTLREQFLWYNIEPAFGIRQYDLNPSLNREREKNLVTTLDLEFNEAPADPTRWGGIMTGFPGGGLDISKGQFIEIWINDFKPDSLDRGGVVYLELGTINENFFRPESTGVVHDEDSGHDGFVQIFDDTGLDGVFNPESEYEVGDNYFPTRIDGRFTKINGTENNHYYDTEDLDRSGLMEERDYYFRYALRLDSDAEVDIRRDYSDYQYDPKHTDDSWRLYRINLDEAELVQKDGIPSMNQIRHMRIWVDSIAGTLDPELKRLQIAGLKIVGNRWEEDGIWDFAQDTLVVNTNADFTLGVINTKTEPIRYKPPVLPAEQNEIYEKEQSLLIEYEFLEPGQMFLIRKYFAGSGQNFTDYRDLNFWVYTDALNDSLEYFFRIAFDSRNYYEITAPLTGEYFGATGWMLTQIPVNDLTQLKFLPPDSVVIGQIQDLAAPGRIYTAKLVGTPDLHRVRYLYAGLRNISTDPLQIASGELWLNDVYLGSVKRDIDFTTSLSSSVNLGNIMTVNARWSRSGPDYRRLQQKRGSGSLIKALNYSVKTNVEHFIPLFGFSIPVVGSYGKNVSYPKFTPSSDTEVEDKTMQDSLRTESVTRGFSTTLNRKGSKNPLLKYTFDKITTNFSMSQTMIRSPSSLDTSVVMNGTFDYQISWGRKHDLRIFKNYGIRYWFNSLTYRMNASRSTRTRYRFVSGNYVSDPKIWTASLGQAGSASYVPFPSLTTSFRMTLNRDLRIPHEFLGVDIGTEINRTHSTQASYKPPPVWLLKAFSPDFNFSSSYYEDSNPNIRQSGDPSGVRNARSNYALSGKSRFDIGKFFEKLVRKLGLEEKADAKGKSKGGMPSQEIKGGSVAPSDTAGAQSGGVEAVEGPPEKGEGKKRDPLIAFRKLGGILSRVRMINASVQRRASNNYQRIPERPSLAYQLGLSKNSGVAFRGTEYSEPEKSNTSISFNIDSGTQITQNIDVAARYSRTHSKTIFRGSESASKSINWPNLDFSWKGLERYGLFGPLVRSASAKLSIQKTRQESGKKGSVDSENSSFDIRPSLSANWKNGINSSVLVLISTKTTESHGSKNETSNLTVTVGLKKSFTGGEKGFRIPLPFISKRVKFKSRLDSSLNISYSKRGGKRYYPESTRFEELPGSNSLKVSPRFTYNFSSSLNGSFFVDYSRAYSDATGRTTTIVRVGISTILTF